MLPKAVDTGPADGG